MKRFFYINKRYIKELVKGSAEVFIITLVVYIFGLLFLLVGKVLNLIPNVKDLTPILSTVIGVILGLYIEKNTTNLETYKSEIYYHFGVKVGDC
jgi:positive regulator of sigma E activity